MSAALSDGRRAGDGPCPTRSLLERETSRPAPEAEPPSRSGPNFWGEWGVWIGAGFRKEATGSSRSTGSAPAALGDEVPRSAVHPPVRIASGSFCLLLIPRDFKYISEECRSHRDHDLLVTRDPDDGTRDERETKGQFRRRMNSIGDCVTSRPLPRSERSIAPQRPPAVIGLSAQGARRYGRLVRQRSRRCASCPWCTSLRRIEGVREGSDLFGAPDIYWRFGAPDIYFVWSTGHAQAARSLFISGLDV